MQFSGQSSKDKAAINDRILSQLRSQAEKQKMNKEQAQQLYDRLVQAQAKREASVGMMRVQSILKDSGPSLSKSPSQAKRVSLLHKDLPDRTSEIIENRKTRIQEMKFLRNQIQEEKNKEECTFTPKINSYSVKRSTSRKSQDNHMRHSTPDLSGLTRHSQALSPKGLKSPNKKANASPTRGKQVSLRASTGAFSWVQNGAGASHQEYHSPVRRSVSKNGSGTPVTRQSVKPLTDRQPQQPKQAEDCREVISVSQLCRNFELMAVGPAAKKSGPHPESLAERKHSITMKKAKIQSIAENTQTKPLAAKTNDRPSQKPTEKMVGTPRLAGKPLQDPDYDKENSYQQSNRVRDRSPVGKTIESPLTFAKSSRLNVTFEGAESVCSSPVFCKPQPAVHPKNNPFYDTFQPKPQVGSQQGKRALTGRQGVDQFFP